ncbi:hypothetical protein JDV02_002723 [Purpureocillium takamizusanense]|uniref:Uncharacterized protein n=1 Tax=Purpureocillium takamizusanense TaxID=2060973 RepID=A0A9Q8QC32_9HYPO|nr:uncharacterized protein JDV02_002723 [Purpureocillium takamizusanense]UNI16274.1 hypothetical protein JDV02_002723 [Purpureocillium takamizusanense]
MAAACTVNRPPMPPSTHRLDGWVVAASFLPACGLALSKLLPGPIHGTSPVGGGDDAGAVVGRLVIRVVAHGHVSVCMCYKVSIHAVARLICSTMRTTRRCGAVTGNTLLTIYLRG